MNRAPPWMQVAASWPRPAAVNHQHAVAGAALELPPQQHQETEQHDADEDCDQRQDM